MGSFGLMTAPTRTKKEVSVPRSKEFGGDPLVYKRDFLLEFRNKFVQMPPELVNSSIEIVLNEQVDSAQWTHLERPAAAPPSGGRGGGGGGGRDGGGGQNDSRNWRTRTEMPARDDQGSRGGGGGREDRGGGNRRGGDRGGGGRDQGRQPAPMPPGPGPDIKKAETPWQIGQVKSDNDKLLRSVKGILNKITPEKFDKLSDQIVTIGISSADTLRSVISLIFDKAVAEPTFCSLYSKLCVKLSMALPEFPPAEGEQRSMTFRRILLNTCQEEFEGAAAARATVMQEIAEQPDMSPEERELKMRKVKLATLGNIRLIGELFKEKMIMEKILHACINDLLGPKPKDLPPEENVEALCNLLMTVGKHLDASPRQAAKPLIEAYFARLQQFCKNDKLPSRIRFMSKDVIDLRKNKWIPRREKLEAKTIEQVHAEAAAEMGIARPGRPAGHGPPPSHMQHPQAQAPGGGAGLDDDRIMFPEGPSGPQNDGWEVAGRKKKVAEAQATGTTYSALTGPYVPNANFQRSPAPGGFHKPLLNQDAEPESQAAPAPPVASADAPPAAAKPEEKGKPLSEEELGKKLDNLLEEFLNVRDQKEVLLALEEFASNGADKADLGKLMARKVIDLILAKSSEKDGELLSALAVAMVGKEFVTWAPMVEQLMGIYETMEDLALDVPMAPKLMGAVVGTFIIESKGEVTMSFIQEACEKSEDIFTRRDSAFPIFKHLKAKGPFMKLVMEQKPDVKAFLMDEAGPEELKKELEKEGLGALWS